MQVSTAMPTINFKAVLMPRASRDYELIAAGSCAEYFFLQKCVPVFIALLCCFQHVGINGEAEVSRTKIARVLPSVAVRNMVGSIVTCRRQFRCRGVYHSIELLWTILRLECLLAVMSRQGSRRSRRGRPPFATFAIKHHAMQNRTLACELYVYMGMLYILGLSRG